MCCTMSFAVSRAEGSLGSRTKWQALEKRLMFWEGGSGHSRPIRLEVELVNGPKLEKELELWNGLEQTGV